MNEKTVLFYLKGKVLKYTCIQISKLKYMDFLLLIDSLYLNKQQCLSKNLRMIRPPKPH